MKKIALIASSIIFLVSCGKKKEGIEIYNSYDVQINVEVDGIKHTLPSNDSYKIKNEEGSIHVVASILDSTIMDTTFNIHDTSYQKGAIINVSGEDLYLMSERYGGTAFLDDINALLPIGQHSKEQLANPDFLDSIANDQYELMGVLENNRKNAELIVLDTFLLMGHLRVVKGGNFFIPKIWDYGPSVQFPDEIEAESNTSNNAFGLYKNKLFKKDDLLEYYLINHNW